MYDLVPSLPSDFSVIRNNFLDRYQGKNMKGIDADRIDDYFASRELNTKPYVLVTPRDLERVHKIDTAGSLRGIFKNGGKGAYVAELGMSIVMRDPKLEKMNSSMYTEGLVVHEGAHSTADISPILRARGTNGYQVNRVGMAMPQADVNTGFALEEGWADIHRADYLSLHVSAGSLAKVGKVLNWKKDPDDMIYIPLLGRRTPVPFKYTYLDYSAHPIMSNSSIAGFALELLIDADPEIYKAMHAGRSNIEGLRNAARRIDALSPGLYTKLRQGGYGEGAFSAALHSVIDRVPSKRI